MRSDERLFKAAKLDYVIRGMAFTSRRSGLPPLASAQPPLLTGSGIAIPTLLLERLGTVVRDDARGV